MKIVLDTNVLVAGLLPQAPEEPVKMAFVAFGIPAARRSEGSP
jgi:hypothetical protein